MKVIALKKWESTQNLRVHAHGYYLELIIRASCKDNYPRGINSSAPMILHSTFEYYPLVPRGYRVIALRLMSFDEAMPFLVIAMPWFWVVVNREHRIPFAHLSIFSMSSLFDCILLKPLDIMCRGHQQYFDFSHVSIEFMTRNTFLAPR